MCHPSERDGHGRWPAGTSGNPKGRKPVSAVARLVDLAAEAGATVTILLPPRARARVVATDDEPLPPVAA